MISEDGTTTAVTPNADGILVCKSQAGRSYRLRPNGESDAHAPYASVSGKVSSSPKRLGTRTIGLSAK